MQALYLQVPTSVHRLLSYKGLLQPAYLVSPAPSRSVGDNLKTVEEALWDQQNDNVQTRRAIA